MHRGVSLFLAALLAACTQIVTPAPIAERYCLAAFTYHVEIPASAQTFDLTSDTASGRYWLKLYAADSIVLGGGSYTVQAREVYGGGVTTYRFELLEGTLSGLYEIRGDRLYFYLDQRSWIGDAVVHHTAPKDSAFVSSWDYEQDAQGNRGALRATWRRCP